MSSSSGVSRTRSIRKPAVKGNESAHNEPVQSRNEARNVSPSRLPMTMRTRSTTSSTAASSSTTTTTTSRTRAPSAVTSRQTSGVSSMKAPTRPGEHYPPATTKPLGRAPSIRQAPQTATSSTATSRVARTARPSSSDGAPTKASKGRQLGHSRAKSTVTSLTTATTLRPLSHVPSTSTTIPSPTASTASSTSTSTQTASTSSARTQTRSQTLHTRVPSQSQSHSTATTSSLTARRPAFNTNQQHYSPAKSHASKPLTSTFLAPPSPSKQPVNVALTAETSRLQTELLQLSLLHREAHAVSASWHASARSKLGARFEALAVADRALRIREREGAEVRGLQDLIRWGNASPEASSEGVKNKTRTKRDKTNGEKILPLDEKIHFLDQVLNGVWVLGEPGGRYQRAVRAFEGWALQVAQIRAAQRRDNVDTLLARGGSGIGFGDDGEETDPLFVSDLNADAWKRDHAGLVRVLEGWRRMLDQLGDVDADYDNEEHGHRNGDGKEKINKPLSGLARTLRGCRCLVHDMLAELQMMEQIEQDALAAEEEWIEKMEARLSVGDGDSRHRRTEDVPPWKMLVF